MKPHEILQKIIDEEGSCDWITYPNMVCDRCPLGGAKTCAGMVNKSMNNFTDKDYLEVAKRMLADLEADRIILGEDIEE